MRHPFKNLKLKMAIIESGIQQAKLAEAIGTSPSQVSRWVRGHNVPTPETLCAILRAIGWSDERISELRLVDFYPLEDKNGGNTHN